jgi:hypothetical protein
LWWVVVIIVMAMVASELASSVLILLHISTMASNTTLDTLNIFGSEDSDK